MSICLLGAMVGVGGNEVRVWSGVSRFEKKALELQVRMVGCTRHEKGAGQAFILRTDPKIRPTSLRTIRMFLMDAGLCRSVTRTHDAGSIAPRSDARLRQDAHPDAQEEYHVPQEANTSLSV